MELTGTALVTGGGSGIGLACATRLAADGAAVTLMGRSAERLRSGRDQLLVDVPAARVTIAEGDVADETAVEAAVRVASAAGPLHHVVAAAGVGAGGPVTDLAVETWDHVLGVNLTGAMLTVKQAARAMVAHGEGGSIVAISSIAGLLTHRLMTAYCVSKAGLEMLVRNSADELGAHGIRVNAVRPGLVPTEIADGLVRNDGIVADYLDQMPLARLGTTGDVAEGVRYLLGPESGWVTGQILAIDGGHTLRRGPDLLAGA
ncbi:MAG: SDR family oxidoreductase [Actinomycetota bacterium]